MCEAKHKKVKRSRETMLHVNKAKLTLYRNTHTHTQSVNVKRLQFERLNLGFLQGSSRLHVTIRGKFSVAININIPFYQVQRNINSIQTN